MNKSKKYMLRIVPVIFMLMLIISTNVFAFGDFKHDMTINTNLVNEETGALTNQKATIDAADNAVKRIWGTVSLILQICAVAAIVLAGVRYMFASADGKADIKKQTVGLIVGAVLVFGASTVVSLIVDVTKGVAGK